MGILGCGLLLVAAAWGARRWGAGPPPGAPMEEPRPKVEVATAGAEAGEWTMDFDAALALAKQKDLPLLVNFTGSDWCSWCLKIEAEVFTKQVWGDYARTALALVTIDFPRDTELVPEKYRERNKELAAQFKINGFPTYVLLDSDGVTALGRLRAADGSSPEVFIYHVKGVLMRRDVEVQRFIEGLPETAGARYKERLAEIREHQRQIGLLIASGPPYYADVHTQVSALREKLRAARQAAAESELEIKAMRMTPERGRRYVQLHQDLRRQRAELEDWLSTDPLATEANLAQLKKARAKIEAAVERIAAADREGGEG